MKYYVMSNRFILEILKYVNTRNERGADLRIVSMMPPLQGEQEYTTILEERRPETDNRIRPNHDPLLEFVKEKLEDSPPLQTVVED